jgi:hypothetical protein
MSRLLALYAGIFFISYAAVAAIKVVVVGIVLLFKGGHYDWHWNDFDIVFKQGTFMALVFCVLVTIWYMKNRR